MQAVHGQVEQYASNGRGCRVDVSLELLPAGLPGHYLFRVFWPWLILGMVSVHLFESMPVQFGIPVEAHDSQTTGEEQKVVHFCFLTERHGR
jgi:hypothetical protein